MKTFQETILLVEDVEVTLRRKAVRTLRVVIRPPDGRVLATAPLLMPEAAVRAFLSEKLSWIRRHRESIRAREPRAAADMESGDTVFWLGRPYRLSVRERSRGIGARIAGPDTLELYAPPGADAARRIWLNLELATRPLECLEYVVAHELAHLIERNHNPRFHGILDRILPDWRKARAALKNTPPPRPD